MKIIGIYRAKRFSPSKEDGDRRILDAVLENHRTNGAEVSTMTEEFLCASSSTSALSSASQILSMARSDEALRMLDEVKDKCLNKPDGIRVCNHRSWFHQPGTFNFEPGTFDFEPGTPVWIKRADGCAEIKDDVCLCHKKEELDAVVASFKKRGIKLWVTQPHYEGDLLKCYGVAGTDFFLYSYPTDTGQTKFGLEKYNGKAHHYPFSEEKLKEVFNSIATEIGIPIYGGDAVITESGDVHIIDFNDWPSFSPCREMAAKVIYNVSKRI